MKTQNPWMGRAKGSAGGMTASKVYDKNVLKAKAFEVNNPNTAAQQNQRTFFKEVSDLVNQLTEKQCRFLCPRAPKGMSRRNFLSKQLASYVTTSEGQKIVDLENLKTLGNAKEVDMPQLSVNFESEQIQLEWNNSSKYAQEHSAEYPTFLLFSVEKRNLLLVHSDDKFSEGGTMLSNPMGWTGDDEVYGIMFNTKSTTPLTSFDTMEVSERPAR